MAFGCCCVWPHDGTHQSKERHGARRGTPEDGEESRLPPAQGCGGPGWSSQAAGLICDLP